MPKVSIVVPIYGVEKYIERCARSLFEQTFDDIEYIFVNDSTKDASIEVLQTVIEEYPHRKNQIKILHHPENRGLPQARKTGILAAKGDYIINFDSDDWVEHTIIEVVYTKASQDKADIVVCDIYKSNGNVHKHWKCGDVNLGKMDFFVQMCIKFEHKNRK
jgi:glycosyltransferase involved in cell wall biosynthesis